MMSESPHSSVPSHPDRSAHPARRLFEAVTLHPRKVLAASLLIVLAAATALPTLEKDTRSDAFVPPDAASLAARDHVREVFGLSDPLVVAIVAPAESDVFTPETLALVEWLTRALEAHPGIDGARVTSLATESDIRGTEEGMHVEAFMETAPGSQAEADVIREAVMDFPLYVGSLVARDAGTTILIAELEEDFDAAQTYRDVVGLAERAPVYAGESIHVAGEGGLSGFLGDYIDADARVMVPVAFVAVTLILFCAYRTPRSVLLANFIVVGGIGVTLGAMAAAGVPYYLITTALPVILIAISVADAIHILGHYYREMIHDPQASQRELVVRAMCEMLRPIAITSVTDMTGFLALAVSTEMPPLFWFGIFASIGVAATFAFSVFTLPAALSLLPRCPSPAIRPRTTRRFRRSSAVEVALARLGVEVARNPGPVLAAAAIVAGFGFIGVRSLEIDREAVRNFRPDVPIRMADEVINRHMDGSHYLDVLIEAEEPRGLLEPRALAAIERVQSYAESLPHVGGTSSVVDYLKQMNRALHASDRDHHDLPDSRQAVAQALLVYEMEGDESEIDKSVDYEYQRANLRIVMNSGRYSDATVVVEEVEQFASRVLPAAGLDHSLAGRVYVDYCWMRGIESTHFRSVAFALVAVFATAALLFRSIAAGMLTVVPVMLAILMIYAVMSASGMWLGTTTSMFAAISIGLGVDFSVHLIERIRTLVRQEGMALEAAVAELFPTTGRELLFNFASAGLGFGVVGISQVPTLVEFGVLTLVAVGASFVGGLVLIPSLICLIRPRFVCGLEPRPQRQGRFAGQVIASGAWDDLPKTGPSSSSASSPTTLSPCSR